MHYTNISINKGYIVGMKIFETLHTVKFETPSTKMSYNTTGLYLQLWCIMYNVHKRLSALNVNSIHNCWKWFSYWWHQQRRWRQQQQNKILNDAKSQVYVETAMPVWFQQHRILSFCGWWPPPRSVGAWGPLHSCIPIKKTDGPVNKYHSQYTTRSFKQLHSYSYT
jgi:hypothetical protein